MGVSRSTRRVWARFRRTDRDRAGGRNPKRASRVLGQIDLIRRGELLHPLAETYGVAVGRVDHLQVTPDRPDHDLAGIETHAHGEAELAGSLQLLGVAAKLVLQIERRVAGAPCRSSWVIGAPKRAMIPSR